MAIALAIGLTVPFHYIMCCPMTPANTPAEEVNIMASTKTPAEAPLVAAMTPTPTHAPADDTTVTTTTIASNLDTGNGVDNTCIICPNGTDIGNFSPYAKSHGDFRTCGDLIDEAKQYETGSNNSGWFKKLYMLYCYYTKTDKPSNTCPDGATAGDEYVPEYVGNSDEWQHARKSLRVPNNLKLGLMHVECISLCGIVLPSLRDLCSHPIARG